MDDRCVVAEIGPEVIVTCGHAIVLQTIDRRNKQGYVSLECMTSHGRQQGNAELKDGSCGKPVRESKWNMLSDKTVL
jgi:hypothetical protein